MRRMVLELLHLLSELEISLPMQTREDPEAYPRVVPLQLSDYYNKKAQAEVPRLIHTKVPRAEMKVSTRKKNNSVRLPQIRGPDQQTKGRYISIVPFHFSTPFW